MKLHEFVGKVVDEVHSELQMSLDGMELEQVMWRPSPASNSMAWLAWHIARMQDARAAELDNENKGQLWVTDGWHARFKLPPDPANNGRGHTDDEVDAVQPDSVATLTEYATATFGALCAQLSIYGEASFSTPLTGANSGDKTLGQLTERIVHGGLAHVGQLMYVRGLIEERHWFPR